MRYLKLEDEIHFSRKRCEIRKKIENMFLNEGYMEIEPSSFESFDSFTYIDKRLTEESMVKIIGAGSEILILRPDNTTSIIRSLIPRWQNGLKLKLFYNSPVYRIQEPTNIKEIRQMGIEYLGENSLKADKEVILLSLKILNQFNDKFILEMSNSKFIDGLFKEIDSSHRVKKHLKNLIYRKNKHELVNYIKSLNISKEIFDVLANITELQGNIDAVEKRAKKYYLNNEMKEAIDEIKNINEVIKKEGYINYVQVDMSMVTKLDYYDGLIFKGYLPGSFKEIISGGRYDSFTEVFGRKIPAIGLCINVDELTETKLKEGK